MTEQEARGIYRTLFVAFPGYRSWLEKTETADETLSVWCKTLSRVSHEAGVAAADMMISGERKMPEAYERDSLPLLLKSYASRIEQDERKRRATEEHRSSRLRASDARSGADERFEMKLGTAYGKLRQLDAQVAEGVIDKQTRNDEAERIMKLAMTPRGRASA